MGCGCNKSGTVYVATLTASGHQSKEFPSRSQALAWARSQGGGTVAPKATVKA